MRRWPLHSKPPSSTGAVRRRSSSLRCRAGEGAEIRRLAKRVTYGWGVVPVEAEIAGIPFATSLFPRDGTYLLPLKDKVRRAIGVTAGDRVVVSMTLGRSECRET